MIEYKKGYKYQLAADYKVETVIIPKKQVSSEYLLLEADGTLTISKGYAWDGPSGPTIDTKNFMRGSLVHDAFYQLMREGKLDMRWRKVADKLLHKMCIDDGMSRIRAWYVYNSVAGFAKSAAMPDNRKITQYAP